MELPRTELRRPHRAGWIIAAIALLAGAAGAFYLFAREGEKPVIQARPAPPAVAAPAETTPPPVAAPPPADPRFLLEAVSQNALYRSAVSGEEGIRRWASVTDNLAEGESPRKALGFLAPARPFSTVTRGGKTYVAAASYARYDGFAALVDGVDAAAAARAYRALHGPVEAAYRVLGYPDGALDRATARALGRLAATPVPQGEVEVVADEGQFVYADPRLENLTEAEKHLLRMGPRNERLIQAKARALLEALGLAQAGSAGR